MKLSYIDIGIREEIAKLKKQDQTLEAEQKKQKTDNSSKIDKIPWFLVGALGSDLLRKTGLFNANDKK